MRNAAQRLQRGMSPLLSLFYFYFTFLLEGFLQSSSVETFLSEEVAFRSGLRPLDEHRSPRSKASRCVFAVSATLSSHIADFEI